MLQINPLHTFFFHFIAIDALFYNLSVYFFFLSMLPTYVRDLIFFADKIVNEKIVNIDFFAKLRKKSSEKIVQSIYIHSSEILEMKI